MDECPKLLLLLPAMVFYIIKYSVSPKEIRLEFSPRITLKFLQVTMTS